MTYMNYVNKHTISNTQNRNGKSVDGSDSLAVLCILNWNFKTEVNKIKTYNTEKKKRAIFNQTIQKHAQVVRAPLFFKQ